MQGLPLPPRRRRQRCQPSRRPTLPQRRGTRRSRRRRTMPKQPATAMVTPMQRPPTMAVIRMQRQHTMAAGTARHMPHPTTTRPSTMAAAPTAAAAMLKAQPALAWTPATQRRRRRWQPLFTLQQAASPSRSRCVFGGGQPGAFACSRALRAPHSYLHPLHTHPAGRAAQGATAAAVPQGRQAGGWIRPTPRQPAASSLACGWQHLGQGRGTRRRQ